jgi:hypothetical protein
MHVITHFYNEEFLLPFWLKHHVPLFDHGIMIDYGSTDRSVEIIRELAPNWEIRPTKNEFFVEPEIGQEVMAIEEGIKGWKVVLNITEFILHPDLRAYTSKLNKPGICTTGVIMVDKKSERGQFDPEKLLIAQKNWGYFETDVLKQVSTTGFKSLSRSRLLHQQPRGKYNMGRHRNGITREQDPNLFLCWFGWSPFTQEVKDRKKQIQTKAPERQKKRKLWAKCYVVNDNQLEDMYLQEEARSYNLLDNAQYAAALQRFKDARSGFFERHME